MNDSPKKPVNSQETHPENHWVEFIKTVAFSLAIALGIRTFILEPRYIPTGSMLPTLQINDRLIIDKISYRFSQPERGDIIVFHPPGTLKNMQMKEALIKRIVAVGGDTIEIKEGVVYINGKILPENYIASVEAPAAALTENSNHQQTTFNVCPPHQRFLGEPITVPPNSYIVLGDNRDNSYDSRCWGVVERTDIIGQAIFRFLPFNRMGKID